MKAAGLIMALVLFACGAPDAATENASEADLGVDAGVCIDCACPADPPCDPSLGGSDCDTGCCGQVEGSDGTPAYQCVTPACVDDSECADGELCQLGATCADNACGCANDADPDDDDDRDLECCTVSDVNGVCCATGELDLDGNCVCPDPRMTDDGWGCECQSGLVQGDDGMCHCDDPSATYDPETGACECPPGTIADDDPYTGELLCDDPGPDCGDPNAEVDPDTGECVCIPGYLLGDTAGGATAECVPIGCGDGVCGAGESCESCDFDCSCDPEPDAGVPDAAVFPDAAVAADAGAGPGSDAGSGTDAGSGSDGGIGYGGFDGGLTVRDAGVVFAP